MIDFKKKLATTTAERKTNPIELYSTLDRKSIVGPLRPTQEYVLKDWYENRRDDRDLIIKLHTGEGKTLIGLLVLQSRINEKVGPCIYLCPNKYLVKQVCDEANKFGIPYCVEDSNGDIPDEFESGEKIMITNVFKVFNGKSKFGINNTYKKVNSIVLDDSHACIDAIKDAFTITIEREVSEDFYCEILSLFAEDLREQGEGSYLDILDERADVSLPVPYWSWNEKKSEVLRIISKYSQMESVCFVWPLIKDKIENYCCHISGSRLEIAPYKADVDVFGSFSQADHRILMSATTQDDTFFIKGFSFDVSAVRRPLLYPRQKWSGEKMIIIPSLINEECDRNLVVTKFSGLESSKFGMLALVPNKRKAAQYGDLGGVCADKQNITVIIDGLKKGKYGHIVVVNNRYDGIDLPDEACRIMIIDSMPFAYRLSDRYEEKCRPNSEVINKRLAQKIEQGLGRGVRGEKDYCAILVIGNDLVRFMRSTSTQKLFSNQTRKQIEIGIELGKMAQEEVKEGDHSLKPICELIKQMLNRDEGWKEYYAIEMDKICNVEENDIYDQLVEEARIESLYQKGEYQKAHDAMQKYIDNKDISDEEKGWYLQQQARYVFTLSKEQSNHEQKAAFKLNNQLLKPRNGIEYTRVSYINESRMKRIKAYYSKYDSYSEYKFAVDEYLADLSWGVDSERFENALHQIGELLGYSCQRPDKEIRKGPDNLWCCENGVYILFECKNEVLQKRKAISKTEAGQMNNHCAWLRKEYGENVQAYYFMIIPTNKLAYEADFTENVRIIHGEGLHEFKESIKHFLRDISKYDISSLSDERLKELLTTYHLDAKDLNDNYSEDYYHLKS